MFFSLIFLMILLLTGSMLHAAYTAGARSAGERILLLSGESVLAKYYRPLYEDYHIFARVFSGEGAGAADRLEDELKEWLNGNLLPGEDGAGTGVLTAQEIDAVQITDVDSLLSGDGGSFLDQALACQQYRRLSDVAKRLLRLTESLEGTAAAAEVLEKKKEAEEAYAGTVAAEMELMKWIDGAEWKNRLFFGKSVAAAEVFVKRFWTEEITALSTGINHPEVYGAVSGQYIRADRMIEEAYLVVKEAERLAGEDELLTREIAEIERKVQEITAAGAGEDEPISPENEEGKEGEGTRETARETETDELLEQKKRAEQSRKEIRDTKKQRESEANQLINRLELLAEATLRSIGEAEEAMERMETQRKAAEAALDIFEAALACAEPFLEEEFAAQAKEEADILRRQGGSGYDLEAGRTELARRRGILTKMQPVFSEAESAIARSEYEAAAVCLEGLTEAAGQLVWRGPSFDYSGYHAGEEIEDPAGILQKLIRTGIASIVIPEDEKISKKRLDQGILPSDWREAEMEEEKEEEVSFDCILGFPLKGILKTAAERLLFTEYAGAHFRSYGKELKEKETCLDYEMEYLLHGNREDEDNLNQTVVRIVLLRGLINLAALAADSKARGEASALAKAVSAGIPVFMFLLTTLLLLLWAAELALVETAAMLDGKSVPIIPDGKERAVRFEEIFTMTPSGIRARAKAYESADTGLGAGYPEYVRLFLMMKSQELLNYRSMDLIEVNIRERYDETFRMTDCVCGFFAQVQALIPERFPRFRPSETDGVRYRIEAEFCY